MEKLMNLVVIVLSCLRQTKSGSEDQRYTIGDHVPLYVNTVGPIQNPREKYSYFDLPFCQPDHFEDKKQTLGEALNGDHFIKAPYKLEFRVDKSHEIACHKNLTKEEVSQFRTAIQRDYVFQMLYDKDLPVWSSIGMMNTHNQYTLYKHINFDISYNKDRVVGINVQKYPISLVEITEDKETEVEFYYHVNWNEVDEPFERRMEKYYPLHNTDYQLNLNINTCIIILIFIGFLAKLYVCDLKINLTEVLSTEELASDQEERGWKYIRDNVFECQSQKSLLCAVLGSGAQLLTLTMLIAMVGLFHMFYPHNQGPLLTALVMIYAVTSIVAGYISTSFYCHLEGTNWFKNLLLTGCLFIGPLCITFCIVNNIATYYKASVALSFHTVFELFIIWTLIGFPLLLLGGVLGRRDTCHNGNTKLRARSKPKKLSQEKIPKCRWYSHTISEMLWAGFILIFYVYSQFPIMMNRIWGFGDLTGYGNISFVSFFLALLEMALVSAIFTAKQLGREDPNWWWRSLLRGGSVGLYVYAYCIYYYFTSSEWSGSLQTSFFFGYMSCICYGIFLIFGSVSFMASFLFVCLVYPPIKTE